LEGLEDPNYYAHEGKVYYEFPARFKWYLTSWDGPMTGIATYQGKTYYAYCHQSPETKQDRYYWLYLLTPTERYKEKKYQEWFREYIGLHCDLDMQQRRRRDPKTWKEWWWEISRPFKKHNWYDAKRKELNIDRKKYRERGAVGFFTLYSYVEWKIQNGEI